MITLGISGVGTDGTVCLLRDDEILYAVSGRPGAEAARRDAFPAQSLQDGLRFTGLDVDDIDAVCHPFLTTRQETRLRRRAVHKNIAYVLDRASYPLGRRLVHLVNARRTLPFAVVPRANRILDAALEGRGLSDRLYRYHHQLCHAASVFYTSEVERALVVSLDGYGSGLAGAFFLGENGRIKMVQKIEHPHSMAAFYAGVTRGLGFVPDRDEAEVAALAARGDGALLFDRVRRRFDTADPDTFRFIDANNVLFDRLLARRHRRADVAAAYQAVLEAVVCAYVGSFARRLGVDTVCLAGGLSANAGLNRRIMEIDGIARLLVNPAAGEAGAAVGACLIHLAARNGGMRPRPIDHVYLSRDFSEAEIKRAIDDAAVPFRYYSNGAEPAIATLLQESRLVGRFNGRGAFGPQALGNRSVLGAATDPAVGRRLRERLGRDPHAPFGAAVIGEDAERYLVGAGRAGAAAAFMAVALACRERMKSDCPAVVHADGTARPQVVFERTNPSLHAVLREYRRLSGVSAVINADFRPPDAPLVDTPQQAIAAFRDSRIDSLAMGNFVCWQPGDDAGRPG